MVTERDPGERHLDDHLVGYLQWQHSKGRLVLGDLRAGFSQGLVFGRGSGRGRGRPRRDSHALGLRSSAENRAIRGAAASLGRGQWLVVVLAGQLRRDARFDEAGNVRSLPEDGLHTGPTALAGEVALSGQVAGLRLRWQREDRHVGLVLQHLRFGQRLRLSSRYGRPVFAGRSQASGAIDGGWFTGQRQFYGQLARTPSSWSFVGGFVDRRRNRLRWSGQVRSYGPRFFSPLGSADRRWKTWNERGVVIDLRGSRWRTWDRDLLASPARIHPRLGRLGGGRIRAHVARFSRPTAPRPSPAIRSRLAATRQISWHATNPPRRNALKWAPPMAHPVAQQSVRW